MYIGKTPTVGNFQVCDAISVVNGQAAYTLQVGGVNVAPESANHMLVRMVVQIMMLLKLLQILMHNIMKQIHLQI